MQGWSAQPPANLAGFLWYRLPVADDRFYKALVNRCCGTRLGQEADRLRWFPPLEVEVL